MTPGPFTICDALILDFEVDLFFYRQLIGHHKLYENRPCATTVSFDLLIIAGSKEVKIPFVVPGKRYDCMNVKSTANGGCGGRRDYGRLQYLPLCFIFVLQSEFSIVCHGLSPPVPDTFAGARNAVFILMRNDATTCKK
jgi:hypothetical protein